MGPASAPPQVQALGWALDIERRANFHLLRGGYFIGVKSFASPSLPVLQEVAPPWRTLVLVCSKCEGGRSGASSKSVRKCLKKRLHETEDVRITAVDCLKVCPDHAVTVCVVSDSHATRELYLVSSDEEAEALAMQLRRE